MKIDLTVTLTETEIKRILTDYVTSHTVTPAEGTLKLKTIQKYPLEAEFSFMPKEEEKPEEIVEEIAEQ